MPYLKNYSCLYNVMIYVIIITPDLTNEQQRNGKLLRDEMKLRKNNGEANLWIQRGKVVVRKREGSV